MIRLTILIAWVGFIWVVGVVLDLFSLVPDLSGLSDIGSVLGVAAIVGAVILAMLADLGAVNRWVAAGPFRRAGRRMRRKVSAFTKDDQKILLKLLLTEEHASADLPGNVLAEAIARFDRDPSMLVSPESLAPYRNWLQDGARRSRDSALGRLLIPSRVSALADAAERVVAALDRFLLDEKILAEELTRIRVVRAADAPDDQIRFSDFVTAFSGAVVLADATQTRGGCAADLKVWHDRSYAPQLDGIDRFNKRHRHDPADSNQRETCAWERTMRQSPKTRADDYDGRVLDLKSVSLVRDSRNGFVNFVLNTTESCYAATEISEGACKGLGVDDDDSLTPRWELNATSMEATKSAGPSRLALVTAFAAIVLQFPDGTSIQRELVLSRRASQVRNGGSALSITGGGVINLSIGGFPGDEDDDGFPDPIAAVIRELEEELGITVPRSAVSPEAVYIHNQRGAWGKPGAASTGQLVATTHFTVQLALTYDELKQKRVHASRHGGLYESTGTVSFALPAASESLRGDDKRQLEAATTFARSLKEKSGYIDQRAIIAALYASAAAYTIPATVSAFAQVWRKPWFEDAWSPELEAGRSGHNRLARPLSLQLDAETLRRVESVANALWK
jgi:8-oxo-dGTP pyrophosphatase MutT (NUDIX family)